MSTVEYGLFDASGLQQAQARLAAALQQFADNLSERLEQAVDDAAGLEVSTYVSDDISGVTYDPATRRISGTAKLRALTRISTGGNTLVCIPEKSGEVEESVWTIHADMVQRAQAHRAELLKTAVSAAAGLLDAFKAL